VPPLEVGAMIAPRVSLGSERRAPPATEVRAGVGIIVVDARGRVLLEKRSDCGQWGLPGGRINPGEDIETAARREVKEATGLDVRVTALLGVYSELPEHLATYPGERKPVQLVDVILVANVISGRLHSSDESGELAFFWPHGLPNDIVPPAVSPLRHYVRGERGVIQ